jgi:hypothetical protein
MYGTGNQLRPVIGVEEGFIHPRITLGQQKGLMELPILVHITYIELCIPSIVSPAAENNPPVILCPGVITVRIIRVDQCRYFTLPRSKVHQAEVCLFVPDGKSPIVMQGAQQVPSIGRYPGERGALCLA